MDLTCHKCGFTSDHVEFRYLCKSGWPACGEADLRVCPRCGAETLFSRAEALENEDDQMKELSKRLAGISRDQGPIRLKEAKVLITKLRQMNMRWNIPRLNDFLTQRQRDLFF